MNNRDAIYLFNADSLQMCLANPEALQTLGYAREDMLSLSVLALYPRYDAQRFAELIAPLLADELSELCFETLHRCKNGDCYPVAVRLQMFADGTRRYVHAQVEDVTARLRQQQQLLFSQFAMDNVYVEVYWLDRQGRICYANRQACRALGYSEQELLNLNNPAIEPLCPREDWDQHWEKLKRDGALFFESLHRRRDGSAYPVGVLSNYIRFGDTEYNVAFARDISEQKQLEARISTLVAAANVIIWSASADLSIQYVSPQVESMLGLAVEHFIGVNLMDLIHSEMIHRDDQAMLIQAIDAMLAGSVTVKNLQHRVKNAGGDWLWMSVSMTPILDHDQQLQQIVGMVHDLTLQKQAEEQLRTLNTELDSRVRHELAESRKKDFLLQQQARMVAMGEMIGNIAHQWRQPLNALAIILMNIEDAIRYGEATPQSISQAMRRSQELLSGMSRTIDDFRGFFRNDKPLATTVLAEVVSDTARLLEATLAYHNIKLVLRNLHCEVRAMIHPGELSQALLCLINNAKDQIIDKQIEHGEINVSVEQSQRWALIRVADNAGGIAEETMLNIFDPYFTTKSGGMGLGLYISKLTVEQSMRGQIKVENTAAGAQFSVFLPKLDPEEHLT